MAINPHDDYEALAKLLYPSIEASGNVYYGQTRKLAIDELFDKNNSGFHSHIESQYNYNSKEYDTFFCWELGPLKGIIGVPEVLPTAPMCFAKYKLVFTSKTIENNLVSGTYSSHEKNVSAVFISLEKTYGKIPVHGTAWDGANFYIIEEDSVWYVYIAIKYSNIITDLVDPEPYEYTPPPYKEGDEFTITNLSDSGDVTVILKLQGNLDNTNVYQYFIIESSQDWVDLELNSPVTVAGASKIKFRCKPGITKSTQSSLDYLYLIIGDSTASVKLSGDFRSLQEDKNSVKNYEFIRFLRDNITIIDAHDLNIPIAGADSFMSMFSGCWMLKHPPKLPAASLYAGCYNSMFYGCRSLLTAPELPATTLADHCYNSMFYNCRKLEVSPVLSATDVKPYCYYSMFYGCQLLSKTQDYFRVKYSDWRTSALSFYMMFSNCKSLQVAPCIICDSLNVNACYSMFSGCTSLKTARVIITNDLKDDDYASSEYKRSWCFKRMFKDCSSLTDVYLECPLYTEFETEYRDDSIGLCQEMFSGCTNLSRIFCYMPQKWISINDNYTDWLKDVSPVGMFYYDTEYEDKLPSENKFPENDSGIPSGWERHNVYEKYSDKVSTLKFCDEREYVVASGTNNENNGRGYITDPSTLVNMEKSFDENNSHPMNTYNADGSFNQEIWGYKSFCSPVQFRNGIYTDTLSILSTSINESDGDNTSEAVGSTIKSAENDDLAIHLINGTYTSPTFEAKQNQFIVALNGYCTPEKNTWCYASLNASSYYDDGTKKYHYSSNVSAYDSNGKTTSEISVRGNNTNAYIRAEADDNNSSIELTVTPDGDSSKTLNISKSGHKFTGNVEAGNITVKTMLTSSSIETNYIIAHQGIEADSISTDGSIFSKGDIFALNGKEFVGNLSGEIAKVDKIYTSEIAVSQSSSGINVKSDVTFEKPIYLNGVTSHGDIVVDNGKKFTGNLDGVIPYAERDNFSKDHTVPVGCIVFLKIKDMTANKYNPYEIGTEFTCEDGGSMSFSIGGFGESGILEDSSNLSGRQIFRTLSRCEFSENCVAYALAIRVE